MQRNLRLKRASEARRGGALVPVLIFMAVLTLLAGAAITVTSSSVDEVEQGRKRMQALYAAEAGVNAALSQVAVAFKTGDTMAAVIGTHEILEGPDGSRYYTTIEDNGDDTLTVTATGVSGMVNRTVEAVLQPIVANPMDHAMFAGNFSEDGAYTLELGGTGGQADLIAGDIYSGGDIVLSGDAAVAGELSTGGSITGGSGKENVTMDLPQILTTDYETYNDFDVAALFEGAPRLSDNAGGTAGQLPADNPAHIFRKNPSDRSTDVNSTVKDDYFLEDPYENPTADWAQDGSDAFEVSLPGSANNSVYFIDGNLWLHSRKTFSLKLKNEGVDPTQVTFVVKGNVYFSDNLFYDDPAMDGVAFVALADPDVDDSGNIYFGDPSFGTMQYAEAMLFAENNFYDNNLDAAGSTSVEIRGNMTAGNQLAIDRDYVRSDGSIAHTKLKLAFDERQKNGVLSLPGIPVQADHPTGYVVATWREVATPPADFAPASDTFQIENPAPSTNEDEAWRQRWDEQFGDAWKGTDREGKWGKKKKKKLLKKQLNELKTKLIKMGKKLAKMDDQAYALSTELQALEQAQAGYQAEHGATDPKLEQKIDKTSDKLDKLEDKMDTLQSDMEEVETQIATVAEELAK